MSVEEDYLLKVKVLNNRIYSLMRERGIETVAELARQTKIPQQKLGEFLNMKISPLSISGADGVFLNSALKLADFFGVLPDEMFNEQQLTKPLLKNNAERAIKLDQVLALMAPEQEAPPYNLIEQEQQNKLIEETLQDLSPREQKIIKARYGFDEEAKTYESIAAEESITRERVRQIEQTALRKMRSPDRSRKLRDNPENEKKVTFALTSKHKKILDESPRWRQAIEKHNINYDAAVKYLAEKQATIKINEKTAKESLELMIRATISNFFIYLGNTIATVEPIKGYYGSTMNMYNVFCESKHPGANASVKSKYFIDLTKHPDFKKRENLTKEVVLKMLNSSKVIFLVMN